MSALIETTTSVVAAAGGGDGILDFLTVKSNEVAATARAVAVVLALVFFIWQVVASRAAMARMVVAGLAAGVFIWIAFNVTELKDRVDNEVNGSAPLTQVITVDGAQLDG